MSAEHRTGKDEEIAATTGADILEGDHSIPSANAPAEPFSGPRKARSAARLRLAMPSRPCIPEAGAATDSADARVDGHGHRFGRGVDQPDYAFPPFRLVCSCYRSRFGDPKDDILRILSAIGFILVAAPLRPTRGVASN